MPTPRDRQGRKNSAVIEKRKAEVIELLRPQAAKLYEIADSEKPGANAGYHPLSPKIRYHWTLVPLAVETQETAKNGNLVETETSPKAKQ